MEDDEQVLYANQLVLESGGYKVISTGDAGEALVLYRQHAGIIDLAIIDVIMPGMNGKQLYMNCKQ